MYNKRIPIPLPMFEHYANTINNMLDINLFSNTRKIEYTYARFLLAYTIKKKYPQTGPSRIARFFKLKGKSTHHATIIHSIKTWHKLTKKSNWDLSSQRKILNGYTVDYINQQLDLDYASEINRVIETVKKLSPDALELIKPCIKIALKK
tara:strand:+ start:2510 stop:2959 length:450 start_codon:yes stop_codon:yes gene_type:complete